MKNFFKNKIAEKSDQDKKLDELERVISKELKKLDEEDESDQRWPKSIYWSLFHKIMDKKHEKEYNTY